MIGCDDDRAVIPRAVRHHFLLHAAKDTVSKRKIPEVSVTLDEIEPELANFAIPDPGIMGHWQVNEYEAVRWIGGDGNGSIENSAQSRNPGAPATEWKKTFQLLAYSAHQVVVLRIY